jgi:Tfp pilus assembly protein FimV
MGRHRAGRDILRLAGEPQPHSQLLRDRLDELTAERDEAVTGREKARGMAQRLEEENAQALVLLAEVEHVLTGSSDPALFGALASIRGFLYPEHAVGPRPVEAV